MTSTQVHGWSDDLRSALVALGPRLRRFAYGLTGSPEEADDLVQSAYERALTRSDQWQTGTRLDSWMYRIVQTIWLNRLKSQNLHKRHLTELSANMEPAYDGHGRIESQLTLERIREFVWQMPEEQRVVLLLVAVEGLSYKEASDVIGVPIGTITSRLGRARIAIRDFMTETSEVSVEPEVTGNHESN
jgi:RNA polymerase sigma-70 factor (ECF subfamily)